MPGKNLESTIDKFPKSISRQEFLNNIDKYYSGSSIYIKMNDTITKYRSLGFGIKYFKSEQTGNLSFSHFYNMFNKDPRFLLNQK